MFFILFWDQWANRDFVMVVITEVQKSESPRGTLTSAYVSLVKTSYASKPKYKDSAQENIHSAHHKVMARIDAMG